MAAVLQAARRLLLTTVVALVAWEGASRLQTLQLMVDYNSVKINSCHQHTLLLQCHLHQPLLPGLLQLLHLKYADDDISAFSRPLFYATPQIVLG